MMGGQPEAAFPAISLMTKPGLSCITHCWKKRLLLNIMPFDAGLDLRVSRLVGA